MFTDGDAGRPQVRPCTGGNTYRIAVSRDGRHLLSRHSGDRTRLWDLSTRMPLAEGTPDYSVAFGVEPGTVIGTSDGVLYRFDVATGQTQKQAWPYSYGQFLPGPDGMPWFLTTDDEADKQLVDIATGTVHCTLSGATEHLAAGSLSQDGYWLATSSSAPRGEPVRIWSTTDGIQRWELPYPGTVWEVVLLPGGRCAVAHKDTTQIWDLTARAVVAEFTGTDLALSSDGSRLAIADEDAGVRIYSTTDWETLVELPDPGSVGAVTFTPDGEYLVTGHDDDSIIRLWDSCTGEFAFDLGGVTREVHALAFSPDGQRLATVVDEEVRVWETGTGRAAYRLPSAGYAVQAVAYSPDGGLFAVADDETVRFWDATTGTPAGALEPTGSAVLALAWSPDGGMLATTGEDGTIHVRDAGTWHSRAVLTGPSRPVWYAAFHPEGRHLVVADDETVCAWDIAAEKQVSCLAQAEGRVDAVAIAPDGRGFAVGIYDRFRGRILSIYEAAGMEPAEPYTEVVSALAYSPDGALAVGDEASHVTVYSNPASGDFDGWLEGHAGLVLSLAYSPDSRLLAVGTSNGTVHLWDAKAERRLAMLIALDDGGSASVYDGQRHIVGGTPNGEFWFLTTPPSQDI
ncbi:WD40 repeat domain-containing protein [Actinoplanes sp. NPDC051475]|uniref:WD40 repeat domain-containing protein n=1 Tax=Actinoplanes sp. NPDC051475 TaxID=3157225 RepID=UPI003450BE21